MSLLSRPESILKRVVSEGLFCCEECTLSAVLCNEAGTCQREHTFC